MTGSLPSLNSLAPIIDEMCRLSRTALPGPRTCTVRLWDDGTFDARVTHSMTGDAYQCVRYVQPTAEIVWLHVEAVEHESTSFAGGEAVSESIPAVADIEVLASVAPPSR